MKGNCIFCGTVCTEIGTLNHLGKYHKKHINPFPKDNNSAKKFFRNWRN